jgi:hypothetical protein
MARRSSAAGLIATLAMASFVVSCTHTTIQTTPILRTTLPVLPIPADVQQIAVLYPRGRASDWSSAYGRLEGAAFQLKTFRPSLRIIDRSHMQAIVSEQRFQIGGLLRRQCRPHWADVGRRQRVNLSDRGTNVA